MPVGHPAWRGFVTIVTLVGAICAPIAAQAPAGPAPAPVFEVASVKPNGSADFGGSFGPRPGGMLEIRNNTLRNMVRNAYQLQNFQIVGGPDWFDTARFDVTAKAPMANPTPAEFRAMVQTLLAERFKLVMHRETRTVPIYALVVGRADGRLGAHLTRSATDCAALAEAARRGGPPPGTGPNGRPQCGTRTMPGRILAGGVTMADLARNLSTFAGRMTIDKTGLSGPFDLELEYTPDQPLPPGLPANIPPPPADGASLFTAVQEQLGLKLDSQRGQVDMLVIDAAQLPLPD